MKSGPLLTFGDAEFQRAARDLIAMATLTRTLAKAVT